MSGPRRLLVAALVLLAASTAGAADDDAVVRFTLENGLDVMLRPIQGSAEVSICTCFDVGEAHDPEGRSGLGHLVEHLYVTCAAGDIPVRTVEDLAQRTQGQWNAQTGRTYTVYQVVVPKAQLLDEIRDAAARMNDLHVRAGDLEREVPRVVTELGNMFEAIPLLAAMNRAKEHVCPSPEGARKGGVPAQVEALTLDDVTSHLARCYGPAHATLVVAGAFDVEPTRAAIQRAFASARAGQILGPARPPRPAQEGVREVFRSARLAKTAAGNAALAFAAPAPGSAHYPAFLVLVQRLFAAAQRGLLPEGIQPTYAVLEDPEVLYLACVPKPGEPPEAAFDRLRAALDEQLAKPVGLADRALARMQTALLLDTMPRPDAFLQASTYAIALGLARRAQLGIDGRALGAALLAVEQPAFDAMAADVFGEGAGAAVAVVPPT